MHGLITGLPRDGRTGMCEVEESRRGVAACGIAANWVYELVLPRRRVRYHLCLSGIGCERRAVVFAEVLTYASTTIYIRQHIRAIWSIKNLGGDRCKRESTWRVGWASFILFILVMGYIQG